jgi:HPt (histidine-containing phosphotransfer) domain-containing protein
MLVDEARISVLLNHPNVVQVHELDEDDGSHFIVMEYVDGHAVSRLIRRLKKRGERVDAPVGAGTDAGALLTHAAPAPAATTASASASSGDTASVTSRLAGNRRFAALVTSFAQRLPERIAALRAAHDAGDAAAFADIAHWLKGSAGSVGYDAFTAPAREAENAARAGDLAAAREPLERIESLAQRVVAPASVEAA